MAITANERDGKSRRRGWRDIILCGMLLAACFSLSGCELFDLLTNIGRRIYGHQETVGIVVYPLFPNSFFSDKQQPLVRPDFIFSENVKSALIAGVKEFNGASNTEVFPWYVNDEERIRELYNELDFGDIRSRLAQYLSEHRQSPDWQKDMSAVIFGIFDDTNDHASSYACTLYYFDWQKQTLGEQRGTVTKNAGRAQNGELESLMTNLLHKVYD